MRRKFTILAFITLMVMNAFAAQVTIDGIVYGDKAEDSSLQDGEAIVLNYTNDLPAAMVIADLYKCEVYELAHYINRNGIVIPVSTITKAPSAELREGQKDSDSLPDYSILDPTLYAMQEGGKTPEELIAQGADKEIVEKIVRLKRGSAFKAAQIPPIFNISSKPLAYKEKWLL